MKKYELKYTVGEDGVFRMSTVENPATKTQLVMFDDELQALEFADDEKQVIYSVAMRPNMLIPRKNINGEPAMVFYTEETVNDLQQNFFKNGSNLGATINHDKNVRKDMYCFESWIVQDPEKDKATSLGLQVQKGDWILGQKIDNPEVWADVKSGKLQGFSIEAYLEPVLTTNNIEMTKEEIDARIKEVIAMTAEEDQKKLDEEKLAMADAPPAAPVVAEPTLEELQGKVEELSAENNDLKAKLAEYEAKEVEMSAEVAAAKKVALEMSEELLKGIPKSVEAEKKYSEMTNFEKLQYNRNK
jgi:uncharacterized protein Veg